MTINKFSFRLHHTVTVLICLALLVVLMQGTSWFSQGHQKALSGQVEDLARTFARQVAFSLVPLMENSDESRSQIDAILHQMTDNSRILDASVYNMAGSLVARSGENINVRDRLALNGKRAGSFFNHQLVQPIENSDGPLGFLRVTLDTHVLITEAEQVDNTTNVLRLMMLLALAIGIILTRTLLRDRRTRWQQSPFLLTASHQLNDNDDKQKNTVIKKQDAQKPVDPADNQK